MKAPIRFMDMRYAPDGDVTQFFGENPKLYSQFNLDGHNGIDLVRPHGEPLYAVEDGEIIAVKNNPFGYGKNLRIMSDFKNSKGHRREWVYGHNSENLVKVGDKVKAGDLIAYMGNTGFTVSGSTPYWGSNPYAGTHLHIGLRLIREVKSGWSYEGSTRKLDVINYNNGYKGAIDPKLILDSLTQLYPEANRKIFNNLLTIQSIINSLKARFSK